VHTPEPDFDDLDMPPEFGPSSSRISEPPPSSQYVPIRSPEQDARRAVLIKVVAAGVAVLLLGIGSAAVVSSRKGAGLKPPPAPVATAPQAAAAPPDVAPALAPASAAAQAAPPAPAPDEAPAAPQEASSARPADTTQPSSSPPSTAERSEPAAPPASPAPEAPSPAGSPPAASPPAASAAPSDDSLPLTARIQKALEAGQAGKAVQLAQQLTSQNPGSANAWYMRGAAEQAAGRGGKASFRKCAELAPADSNVGEECKALAGM
jgi:hypothetical protein